MKWTKFGQASIGSNQNQIAFKLDNKSKPESDVSPDAGDGTVPTQSGALIKAGARHVFQMKGFEHAGSYKNKDVIENVLYSIAKIIQGATPARDLPQTKGKTCPDSTGDSDRTPTGSSSQPSPVAAS